MKKVRIRILYLNILLMMLFVVWTNTEGQTREKTAARRHGVTYYEGVSYGPDDLNKLDLWLAKSYEPTPLVIFSHGGGFMGGNRKGMKGASRSVLLKAGISYASIDYRLSRIAPSPAPFHDAALALQYLRYNAEKYNLDPTRICAAGVSAGAGISLWLAFHDDLADPENEDPVKRESSRVQCAGVLAAQTSYDPLWIRDNIGGGAWRHGALQKLFRLTPDKFGTSEAKKLFDEASPIAHLTKDDAPVHLTYPEMVEGNIHSAKFGLILKKKMDALGLECVVMLERKSSDANTPSEKVTDFIIRHLKKQ
jgi:hypothetical protein